MLIGEWLTMTLGATNPLQFRSVVSYDLGKPGLLLSQKFSKPELAYLLNILVVSTTAAATIGSVNRMFDVNTLPSTTALVTNDTLAGKQLVNRV